MPDGCVVMAGGIGLGVTFFMGSIHHMARNGTRRVMCLCYQKTSDHRGVSCSAIIDLFILRCTETTAMVWALTTSLQFVAA